MADKTDKLVVEALRKAAVDRGGLPPYIARNLAGLFPPTTVGRHAALRAFQDGLFSGDDDCWTITDAGFAMLLERTSSRQVLEDCVRALEARQGQLADLRATISHIFASFDGLRSTVERILPGLRGERSLIVPKPTDDAIVDALTRWQADAAEDCPLPELFRQTELVSPGLSVGEFHDGLRRLHAAGRLYLHPWTGPLYDCPEPSYALMIGHEIAYYASGRTAVPRPNYEHAAVYES